MAQPFARSTSDSERVRDAADIVRIVSEHVSLKAKGAEYVGLCPFHDDHSPSMYVVPRKQIFHCFVCGAGGDVFSFIQRYHRMEFREALEYLAERLGVKLAPPPLSAGAPDEAQGHSRADLATANAQAASFFRGVLAHPAHGAAAREVIARRGISPEMQEAFALGAAPNRWDGLVLKITQGGGDPSLFLAAGLLKRRDDSGVYDAFRNRLMFPIRDQIGRVIAFGARRIDDADEPKYLNSPETALFDKSSAVFGIHQAAQAIQRTRTAIVTEGYTDVIACHQAGFANAVATLGTALTPGHARVLKRLCDTLVLLFDGDDAGRRAADRAVEVFFRESLDVRVATLARYTDAKDPDELLKRPDGRETFERVVAGAIDLLEYRFDRLRERLAGQGLAALERAATEEIARLAELGFHQAGTIRRQLVLRRLSGLTTLSEPVISDLLQRARRAPRPTGASGAEPHADRSDQDDPAHLTDALGCLLTEPGLWMSLAQTERDLLGPAAYRSRPMRAIASAVHALDQISRELTLAGVLDRLSDPDLASRAVDLQRRVEAQCEGRVPAYLADCLTEERRRRAGASTPGQGASLHQFVELKRKQMEEFGPQRRAIPRPSGPS